MTAYAWSPEFALGEERMDQTHHEFVELVDAILEASDDKMLACVDRLIDHTKVHFDEESRRMRETDFPPIHCHENEHAEVLAAVVEARGYIAEGKLKVGKVLAQELANWFAGHVDFMDKVLAEWLKRPAAERGSFAGCAPAAGCGTDAGADCATHVQPGEVTQAEPGCGSAGSAAAPGH